MSRGGYIRIDSVLDGVEVFGERGQEHLPVFPADAEGRRIEVAVAVLAAEGGVHGVAHSA